MNLLELKQTALNEIKKVKDLKALNDLYKKYLGKKGFLILILRSLKEISEIKRVKIGKEANELKNLLRIKFDKKTQEIKEKIKKEDEEKEWIDITIAGKKPALGHLHPLTIIRRKVEEIFQNMGFSVVEGPEIETEWYNFDALNFPSEHPARDMHDTLWIKQKNREKLLTIERLLMRTHTSPVQIHYMRKNNPPLRIIVPGRVFRNEATDASHEINFYHIEGLMVGKDVSIANFRAIIEEFFKRFFGRPAVIRLRPGYFPFVEPGFEVDMSCTVCDAKGCPACKHSGWVELLGAGMVHPNVLKNSGLIPKHWQGFAFGMSLDRLAMMKYKINDIRLFYSGDLRFLQQF